MHGEIDNFVDLSTAVPLFPQRKLRFSDVSILEHRRATGTLRGGISRISLGTELCRSILLECHTRREMSELQEFQEARRHTFTIKERLLGTVDFLEDVKSFHYLYMPI